MTVDFDNLRRNIASDYNELALIPHTGNEVSILQDLRSGIASLLACHDNDINVVDMELFEPQEKSQ